MGQRSKAGDSLFYGSFLLLECALWGAGNPLIKVAQDYMSPFTYLTLRFLLAAGIFFLMFRRRILDNFRRADLGKYGLIASFSAASFITSNLSLLYTEATIAGFLMALSIIFTPFLSVGFLKRKLEIKYFLPVVIVVWGMYFLCGQSGSVKFGFGEVLALFSSLCVGLMLVFSSKYIEQLDAVILSTFQTLLSGLACSFFLFFYGTASEILSIPAIGWGIILYLALGCSCMACSLQNAAMPHLNPTYAALLLCSEPIFTAIASYLILSERLSFTGWIGAGLIMAAIVIGSFFSGRRENKELDTE